MIQTSDMAGDNWTSDVRIDVVGRPRKRRFHGVEVLIWLLCIALMATMALAVRDQMLNPSGRGLLAWMPIRIPGVPMGPDAFEGKQQVTLLLVGTDQAAGLCDTIMLAFIDRESKRIGLLSFPRDMAVQLRNGDKCKVNSVVNLTGADVKEGLHALEDTISRNFGVEIDGYAAIDVKAFQEAVDQLGGVDVVVPEGPRGDGLHYDDNEQNLHIHLTPGPQHLNGHDAMGFVRWRQGNGYAGDGDFGRMARQQQFLQAVASKAAGQLKSVKGLGTALGLAGIAHKHVNTDLSLQKIAAIAEMARAVDAAGIDARTAAIKGGGSSGSMGSYLIPDTVATRAAVDEIWAELAKEKPLEEMARIEVLNGCGVDSIASKCREALVKRDFRVVRVGNYTEAESGESSPQPVFDHAVTRIHCAKKFKAASGDIRQILGVPEAEITADVPETSDVDIVVVLGKDYASK